MTVQEIADKHDTTVSVVKRHLTKEGITYTKDYKRQDDKVRCDALPPAIFSDEADAATQWVEV